MSIMRDQQEDIDFWNHYTYGWKTSMISKCTEDVMAIFPLLKFFPGSHLIVQKVFDWLDESGYSISKHNKSDSEQVGY